MTGIPIRGEEGRLIHHEVIDLDDRLIACGRFVARGTSSGIAVRAPSFQVFTLRRGLVIHQEDFDNLDQALQAATRRE